MDTYYVSKKAQENGDHEVHKKDCSFLPDRENRIYLGEFTRCEYAVKEAKKTYNQVNGCYYCCNDCHTT